ncbi:MAG: serine protease [Armatimonadota bacterium]|nr:serine protease [bacterium]MDW8321344.1 serine protease [Armatimonadota bacterium]
MNKWLWAVVVSLMMFGVSHAQNEAAGIQAVVEKVAPSIATVKVVLKTTVKMGSESMEEESKLSLQGVVVTSDGLIMVSNSPFSPRRIMEILSGESMPAGMDYKMTPTSIKVIFGNEDKEYDAFLAATDARLDLAFIKVEGLGERQLTPLDLGSAVDAKLGQQVIAVSRLTKGYDYAPYFALGQVCGEIAKPRRAWMLLGDIFQLGLPVFTLNGDLVGVLTTVAPETKDEGGDTMGFTLFMRLLSGGGSSGTGGVFIIPAQQVKPLVEQASRRATELAAERARRKQEPPAKPNTPAQPAKPKK